MEEKVLHMIGNAHLDPVWLWQWQEGFQETKATFRSALDRMNEYNDFVFTSSSAASYEWIENNDSGMFEEIKARIKEGRWQIVGGWWIQPDCNIPSGESFARQALYGQRYFKEKFGVTATVGYNVDSFGHHGMMPQILQQSGMDSYVFMRPMPQEKGLPGRVFWWESDDGSRVMTFQIPFEYCTWGRELNNHIKRSADEIKNPVNEIMCFYGVGNHGGGPTKENIESIQRLDGAEGFPKLKFSTPNEYFQTIREKNVQLPVFHDDLQHHASGCYSVHSGIKRWNREAENLLIAAEKFSSIAFWYRNQPYPQQLGRAWKNVLFNQFHDILAGTSIEAAYDDARDTHGEAMSIGANALNNAVQSLSWNIDIEEEEGMKPLVVFNPHSWDTKVNVEIENTAWKDGQILIDEKGKETPHQIVQSQATAKGRSRLSFIAHLPSLGYRVYKIVNRRSELHEKPMHAGSTRMENDRFRVEFDPETGYMTSLFDKHKKFEVLKNDSGIPIVMEDKSDTWSHNVLQYKNIAGHFRAIRVQKVEHGPVKTVMRIVSTYGTSRMIQDFTMYKELDHIDVHTTVDWHEKHKVLKLKYDINTIFRKATYEIPYGHIVREENGEEEPAQNWIDSTGIIKDTSEVYGLSILNDGKYSFDIQTTEMSITALRSPIYAHHDPLIPDEEGDYSYIDQGIQRFTYTLLPHEGGFEEAGTVKRAWELNQRPIALFETYHNGTLPQKKSFLQIDNDKVIISAWKISEDNEDMIIRCHETAGETAKAQIELPDWNRKINCFFRPNEIKSFRIPKDSDQSVVETNMLEWE
ncbi:alpha-mannosidase [Alteribacillus sp. HJP-4]|uniref:alpha-mannosidase n=1 Tax=Alteribacillus sp. HJP-4 TaxID=2775394 RepID=UPI0035CD010C